MRLRGRVVLVTGAQQGIGRGTAIAFARDGADVAEAELEALARAVPLGRMARPDDIASVAVFLATDEARFITSQTSHVNGGSYLP